MLQRKNDIISKDNYGIVAKFLHWSMALLIITNYILGLTLESSNFYLLHKQIGLTILLLVILRILWRLMTPYPAFVNKLSLAEKVVAKLGHLALYLLMLIIPLSGIIMVEHHGYPLYFWGLFAIPVMNFKIESILNNIDVIHLYLAHAIIFIATLHALFALKHHFLNKDRTLLRMLTK